MPDLKISSLPDPTSLLGTDVLPVVSGGTTCKATIDDIVTAGGGGGTVTSITVGSGLSGSPNPITGTGTISLSTPVSTADGGSGLDGSGATNGELLIGNGSGFALSTLTAGSNVTITNGAGSITIAATDSGGTVTSITAGTGLTASPSNPITGIGTISLSVPVTVPEGGTGATSLTDHALVVGAGTSAVSQVTGTAGQVLIAQSSADPAFETVSGDVTIAADGTTAIGSNAVTYAKIQEASAHTLIGNPTSGTADVEEITLGSGLSFSGTTLTATGSGGTVSSITAGTGLSASPSNPITGTGTIALTVPVSQVDGGTGLDTSGATDGQVLIGKTSDHSLNLATLTAGTGVSITNGGGSITIAATGSGGTVTAVTASSPLASSGGTTPNITLSGIVSAAHGGSGLDGSGATNGQLLIGNGSGFTLSTLTAGSNVTITNGGGSISLAVSSASPSGSAGGDLAGTYPNPTLHYKNYLIQRGRFV